MIIYVIPASFIKPVSEFLVSPITFIINNFIKISRFPGNGINIENMPASLKMELKKTTRTSKNNPPVIIAKDKNANNSTFIEEVSELFKEIPSNIKQEIRAISSYSFKDKLKKYV